MRKKSIVSLLFLSLLILYFFAVLQVNAEDSQSLSGTPVNTILIKIQEIINIIVYMLMSVATVVFLWGIVKYIMSAGDEKGKEGSKGIIKVGIIGLFLMVSIWGIVKILTSTFVTQNSGIPIGPGYQDPRNRTQ